MNLLKITALGVFLSLGLFSHAQKEVHFYIHSGKLPMIMGDTLYYLSLSPEDTFEVGTSPITLNTTENLELTITNRDINDHSFTLKGGTESGLIEAGETISWTITNPGEGVHLISESTPDHEYNYLGLSTYIHVSDNPAPVFFWELREHQIDLNNQLELGLQINKNDFNPEYYTINDRSFMETNADEMAYVTGSVGEELSIVVVNTGWMKHAVHFHGYHAEITFDSADPERVGYVKETFPLDVGESMVLKLIPHQPGVYPVHDHALMAVNGKGQYLRGMIVFLNITE
jgi:hypothetical protein